MFSFRTTPLIDQMDKALHKGSVGCFCTDNCWRTGQKRYMWQIFEERGNLKKLFRPSIDELSPENSHIRFSADSLSDLDAVIVEIQDVGARNFNFTGDVIALMEVMNEMSNSPSMYVVDHINPAGRVVEGTMPEDSPSGCMAKAHVPRTAHRHGLSLGEICYLQYNEMGAKFPLHVISATATESNKEILPWVIPPAGDIPGLFTCDFYSGGCLWNDTDISPGIGTARPYEFIGAPFIRHECLHLPSFDGVLMRPCTFTPAAGRYAGRKCSGYQFMLGGGAEYHSLLHTLVLLRFFKECCDGFRLEEGFRASLADSTLMDYVLGKIEYDQLKEYVKVSEQKWIRKARKFILYEDSPYRIK